MSTAATSQSEKFIPAKPLKKLSYDYLLFLSSPNYLPFEYSYYVCEYVRHERYLDIYKRCQIGHREILMKIDEEIEEIRKVLYKYLCETKTNYMCNRGYGQECNVMNYLECNLTGGAKEMIEKLKQARKDRKKEFEREKKEQEEKQRNQTKEHCNAMHELKKLAWDKNGTYAYQQNSLVSVSQEWLNEVKRLLEITGENTSYDNIIYLISYLAEQTD